MSLKTHSELNVPGPWLLIKGLLSTASFSVCHSALGPGVHPTGKGCCPACITQFHGPTFAWRGWGFLSETQSVPPASTTCCGVAIPCATQQNLQHQQLLGTNSWACKQAAPNEKRVCGQRFGSPPGDGEGWSCCRLWHDSPLCWGFALPENWKPVCGQVGEGGEVRDSTEG